MQSATAPLTGLRVLDFSTLLPGPLATLILAEAGAEVVKVERPSGGDELRHFAPAFGDGGGPFGLLNRGKASVALDLKDPGDLAAARDLACHADVLVEQFRPGVMDRLGLGYEALRKDNPRLVYCSVTGYGQQGPDAGAAGHDLNYLAATGLLSLGADGSGAPAIPPGLIADIGGGALPAVIDILMALRLAERSGEGRHLDVSMTDNLFAWAWWGLAKLWLDAGAPDPGNELLTGGSPRYQVYRTADDRFMAAAPLEDRFWSAFCDVIALEPALRDDAADPAATKRAVARIIASESAESWRKRFAGRDVCCCIVLTLEEALQSPHFLERGLFSARVSDAGREISALAVPLAPSLRAAAGVRASPALGGARAAEVLDAWKRPRA
jgi:crotonobetainyl-CoA:carnitine CoA-transferase CaiB-like acyl-CoA transferase